MTDGALRKSSPVAWLNESTVVVRCEKDVVNIIGDTATFISAGRTNTGHTRPRIPIDIDPPNHDRYRRILNPLFSRKSMEATTAGARALAISLIDGFVDDGGCDFVTDFAVPWPSQVFLDLMGLPIEDLPVLLHLKDVTMKSGGSPGDDADEIRSQGGQQIYDYLENALAKQGSPDGLVYALRDAEFMGERLTHEELLDVFYNLVLAGLDTVTASLECFIAYLAENPQKRSQIVASPELIPNAVEQLLRWETPVAYVPRKVGIDTSLDGQSLPKGTIIYADVRHANEGRGYGDPSTIDFEQPIPHYAFGKGIHRCLGSHLARMELCIALEEWHRRIPNYWIQDAELLEWEYGIRAVRHLPLRFGQPRV